MSVYHEAPTENTHSHRTVVMAPQERGWAVITRYHGGRWDGFETTYYCRWIWQARREYDRELRRVWPRG